MAAISTAIEIDAPAAVVWDVLTDFAAYPSWNQFLTSVDGVAEPGARLRVRFEPPGGRGATLRPRVLAAVAARELRWLGRLGLPRVFDGEHTFRIEPLGEARVRFTQSEQFRGILVPLVGPMLRRTAAGFELMNRALEARAEAQSATPVTPAAAARAATSTGSHSGENGGA